MTDNRGEEWQLTRTGGARKAKRLALMGPAFICRDWTYRYRQLRDQYSGRRQLFGYQLLWVVVWANLIAC